MRYILVLFGLLVVLDVSAQKYVIQPPQLVGSLPRTDIVYPAKVEGVCAPRADFFSYSTSPVAQRGVRTEEFFYKPVTGFTTQRTDSSVIYTASVELSARWLGRSTCIRTEGSRRAHRVWVNGVYLGSSTDCRLPSEFAVGTNLLEHANIVKIEVMDGADPVSNLPDGREALTEVCFVSQPMAHIADYDIESVVDSLGKGHFIVTATVENGYSLNKPIAVGCILTMEDGRANGYMPIEKMVREHSTEQMVFDVEVDKPVFWDAAHPKQYQMMLYVKYAGQIVEYIPVKGAFRDYSYLKYMAAAPVEFDCSLSQAATIERLKELRKSGVWLLKLNRPQPSWFYEWCDSAGMAIVECANIHASEIVNNSPEFAPEFERRVEAMYRRSHLHPCVSAYEASSVPTETSYALWKAFLKLEINH